MDLDNKYLMKTKSNYLASDSPVGLHQREPTIKRSQPNDLTPRNDGFDASSAHDHVQLIIDLYKDSWVVDIWDDAYENGAIEEEQADYTAAHRASVALNDKLQRANTMERPPPPSLPTMAPFYVRNFTVGRRESKLGTLSEIAGVIFWGYFLTLVLETAICICLLSMIVSYHKTHDSKKEMTSDDQAYDYQKMVNDEDDNKEDETVADELSILERLCYLLDKLQEVYENEEIIDNEEDRNVDDELSVPEGCEEKIPDEKQDEIDREEKLFFMVVGPFLIIGFLLLFVLRAPASLRC